MKNLLHISEDGRTVTFLHDNIVSVLSSDIAKYHPDEQKFIKEYQDRKFTESSLTNPAGIFKGMTQAQVCKAVIPVVRLEDDLNKHLAMV